MSKNRSMTKRACSGFVHARPVSARSLSPLLDGLLRADFRTAAAVQLACEHDGAALCLAIAAHGCQILHGICIQKFTDFVHNKYLQMDFVFEGLLFPFVGIIIAP